MVNGNNFKLPEIPVFNPFSPERDRWWRKQYEYCRDGYWSSGVWMPGFLYFYINFWTIELNKNKSSKRKSLGRPWLRDIEWAVAYAWAEARGFSGFDEDPEYHCYREYAPYYEDGKEILPNVPEDSIYHGKKFMPAQDYLKRIFTKELGKPLWDNNAKNLMLLTARGVGKDLRWDTKLHTTTGTKLIKDVEVGDKIYGADGKLTTVLERFDFDDQVQHEITFADGRKVVSGEGHLWTVYKKLRKGYTKETKELREILKDYKIGKRGDSRYFLKMQEPVEYEEKELKVDPYLMGVLLGDGGLTTHITFTTVDEEILDLLKTPEDCVIKSVPSSNYGYSIITEGKKHNPLLEDLKYYKLIGKKSTEKEIPNDYLYGSKEQRLELLRGLMDTDGYIGIKGSCDICLSNKKLSDQVKQLCESLGIRCKQTVKKTTHLDSYKLNIITSEEIVKLKRKKERLNNNPSKYSKRNRKFVAIRDIKELGVDKSVCIAVDNKDKLFLVDDFVPTHNSFLSAGMCIGYEYLFSSNTQIVVGAGDAKFSTDLLGKVKLGFAKLPGGIEYNNEYFPPPFYKNSTGSMAVGKILKHEYQVKIGESGWVTKGSRSSVKHVTFKDNHMAANGTRPSILAMEEIGAFDNFMQSYLSSVETMMNGAVKFGSAMMTGCVCAGTKVWTSEGKLVNIEDLKKEDGILGYDGHEVVKQNINYLKQPEKKECYNIITNSGRNIRCSDDHPFMCSTNREFYTRGNQRIKKIYYKEAHKLKKNDQILVPTEVPIFGNKEFKNARTIGLLIGDGYYGEASPTLGTPDVEILEYLENNYNCVYRKNKEFITKDNRIYKELSIQDNEVTNDLKEFGIHGQVKEFKRLPNNIHEFNKESLSKLLAGYFDADGNVYYNEKKNIVRVVLTSVVYELLEQVKYELLKFGIHSTISKEKRNQPPSEEYKGQKDYIYRLYINSQDDVIKFRNNIPILCKRKIDNLHKVKDGVKSRKLIKNGEFVRELSDRDSYLKDNTISNVRYETVKSVEYIGKEYVYNLNCGPNHTYISNGFIHAQTGGDMNKGTIDAHKMFYDPDAYDILAFDDQWEGAGKIGLFIPAYLGLNQFKNENGETNIDAAKHYLNTEREKKRKSKDRNALNMELQYRPIVPSEAFLSNTGNLFDINAIKRQLSYLETDESAKYLGQVGRLDRGEKGELVWVPEDNNKKVDDWPIKPEENNEGAIVIYEHPSKDNIPYGLYSAGIDPYAHDHSTTTSVGACYIYKRFNDFSDTYDMIVAEYVGKPSKLNDYYENIRRLLEYYNARALYENNIKGLHQYFETKHCTHLLVDQPDELIRDIVKDSKVQRGKGIHMTKQIAQYAEILLRDLLAEEYAPGKSNYQKIYSKGLLKELLNYNEDNNFDRIYAMFCVVLYNQQLHKLHIKEKQEVFRTRDAFFERPIFQK